MKQELFCLFKGDRRPGRGSARLLLLLLVLLVLLTGCASNTGLLGGGNWQASGLAGQNIQALAVDPNQPQHIFAGDASAGVFASTDAGVTWKAASTGLPVPLQINALSFDLSGKKLYAATSAGLFVSSDSAASWSQVKGLPVDTYTSLAFDANTDAVVYLASAHAGLLMSRDRGLTWNRIDSGLPAVAWASILYDPNLQELWAASADTLYRSNKDGSGWRAMSTGLPANAGINALALGPVSSATSDLLFVGTNHGFFLSNDAGQRWVESQTSLSNLKISAILLDTNTPSEVYAATGLGVLRSTDSGQNWNQLATGLPANQPYVALAQGDINNTQIFLASHGIYRYPGTGSVTDPSHFLPILLVLLFFLLLYLFLARTRKRLARRRTEHVVFPPEPAEQAESADATGADINQTSLEAQEPGQPPAGNHKNGRYPPGDAAPEQPDGKQEER